MIGIYFILGALNIVYTATIKNVESEDWETVIFLWFLLWWMTVIGRVAVLITKLKKRNV
jgi:hypothetical protein